MKKFRYFALVVGLSAVSAMAQENQKPETKEKIVHPAPSKGEKIATGLGLATAFGIYMAVVRSLGKNETYKRDACI